MRIAIIHYHLKRGGVTRVIESTLRGFDQLSVVSKCVVLTGESPDSFSYTQDVSIIPGLRYSNSPPATPAPRQLLSDLRKAAKAALGGPPDVWHIHNHSLGKNLAMPGVVALLAEEGESVLLQMHDFAEDGRPQNHTTNCSTATPDKLYPDAENVHYGVINHRDYNLFLDTGMDATRLHLLSNPVESGCGTEHENEAPQIKEHFCTDRLIVYPVRAVRRKNFGELLLWAALDQHDTAYATTLGPTNPNYLAAYERWQAFGKQHHLPVHFGIAEAHNWSFGGIIEAADTILTTSIAEGFGLAFLEPWLFGKGICGRDLPAITEDFKEQGVTLDDLYNSLPIPKAWIDTQKLLETLHAALIKVYAAYGRTLPMDAAEQALASIQPTPDTIDFGGLDEDFQERVITHIINNPQVKADLPTLGGRASDSDLQSNAKRIADVYGTFQYAERMIQIYESIDQKSEVNYLDPAIIVEGFLKPERFRLLRT